MNYPHRSARVRNASGMLAAVVLMFVSLPLAASDLVITGVVDGPLSGGVPKAVEFYALNDITDLSVYGVGSANNGGGTEGEEFTFPPVAAAAGQFIYVATEATGFTSFFGFAPDYTSGAVSINGDDAIELFQNGFVVDVFGDINTDGTGQPWEYLDGWAYRMGNTGPDCSVFLLANWSFSGPNALDGETSNGTAASPFPIGSFTTTRTDSGPCVQSTSPAAGATLVPTDADIAVNFSEPVTEIGSWFAISCTSSGAHTAAVTGGPQSFTLDPDIDFDTGESCTVTVFASQITDVDADDPPDNMPADFELSFDTAAPASGWIINEVHADPDSSNAGDANGDGTRSATQDEFVELVNTGGSAVDITGWILSDGFGLRHTFPAGTIVPAGCGVVVFGGGTPTGTFGGAGVQTASTGSLGLNNGGDDVILNNGSSDVATMAYGSEGGNNQSLTLDPDVTGMSYVRHTQATGGGGTRYSPGTRADGSAFAGCTAPESAWVINELHADPAPDSAGDANGDGTRNGSQDEFVEIINNTGKTYDISGWTLADSAGLRHTFPPDTVVVSGCGVLVFGGGSPTGTFGRMPVQTASVGVLGLNNSGDTMTLDSGIGAAAGASYGSEGGDNQSLTLDPDITGASLVKHSLATGSGGALYSPGTRIDGTQFAGCPQEREIFEIQGAGLFSALEGASVVTQQNVVTALAPDGFFMQTPSARTDSDVDTSDGIFVFTGGAPGVAVGDLVDVTGTVQEFFGFTEIAGSPVVTVTGSSAMVPAPVMFDASVPSPDPNFPSCALEYECYEGMLVTIEDGTVTGPNQRFGTDPIAEVHITADSMRTFREPGVESPGLMMPPIPTWDGNPEVFELDPDKLGLPNQIIPAGSGFSAIGVLGFEFGGYELWPTSLTVFEAPLPVPVRPRGPGELTVGTLNLFRLFDDVDDPPSIAADGRERDDFVVSAAEYLRRRAKLASHIVYVLDSPDILAVQEAEKLGVLQDLAADIAMLDPGVTYTPYLVEGNDLGTIDVGFLVREHITVDAITQLGVAETFVNPLTLEDDILHDRPPLLLEGSCALEFGSFPIAVMTVHNRSLGGIEGPESLRVKVKRLEQALSIAEKVQDLQTADPNIRLVVTGDFNAFEFTDGFVDAVGHIKGDFDPLESEFAGPDLVNPDLVNQVEEMDSEERYSFIFRGSAQVLDHALTSQGLAGEISGVQFGRGNADAAVDLINDDGSSDPGNLPLRSSDHDGLVVFISKDDDADGVSNDNDLCPGTIIPEGVPTHGLGTNRWALTDGDGVFDTRNPMGKGAQRSFTIGDTAGCSCEQIIAAQGLGSGQSRYGCSTSVMESWVGLVYEP